MGKRKKTKLRLFRALPFTIYPFTFSPLLFSPHSFIA